MKYSEQKKISNKKKLLIQQNDKTKAIQVTNRKIDVTFNGGCAEGRKKKTIVRQFVNRTFHCLTLIKENAANRREQLLSKIPFFQ